MSVEAKHITENNISTAWAKAFLASMHYPELSPMTITVTGLSNNDIPEYEQIRSELDISLESHSLKSCHTVANTIFPIRFWNRNRDRSELYNRYKRCQKQIHCDKQNCNGVYFERADSSPKCDTWGRYAVRLKYIVSGGLKSRHFRGRLFRRC